MFTKYLNKWKKAHKTPIIFGKTFKHYEYQTNKSYEYQTNIAFSENFVFCSVITLITASTNLKGLTKLMNRSVIFSIVLITGPQLQYIYMYKSSSNRLCKDCIICLDSVYTFCTNRVKHGQISLILLPI